MASITKRGKYWRAQVRRRGYPEQFSSFDTKAEADAWARNIENQMDRGIWVSRKEAERTTLGEALERYQLEIVPNKSHPDIEKGKVDRWKRTSLARRYLANLRGVDFAEYRDMRKAMGRADNTVRLELAVVSHVFEIARKEWGMEGLLNPLKNIRKPSGRQARDRRLLPGEFGKLLACLQGSGNPWAPAAFELAVETSMRAGMLFEIKWDWIDIEGGVLRIPSRYRDKANKGVPVELPLSSRARSVLRNLPRSSSGDVFGCSRNAVMMVWKRTLKKLNIENLCWHDLRHEATSRYFELGLNPMEVASITGHKGFAMLQRYTHLRAENLVNKLG
jgi:integrase